MYSCICLTSHQTFLSSLKQIAGLELTEYGLFFSWALTHLDDCPPVRVYLFLPSFLKMAQWLWPFQLSLSLPRGDNEGETLQIPGGQMQTGRAIN